MITKFSHTTLFVTDQDKAYDFYINKLGFKVHTDVTMPQHDCEGDDPNATPGPPMRWLTVVAPDMPELEIILMSVTSFDGFDEEARKAIRILLDRGIMGAGAFYTPNCKATYEELKAKGVQFKSEPKEQFYGVEAVMYDGCGNWFSVTEPKAH